MRHAGASLLAACSAIIVAVAHGDVAGDLPRPRNEKPAAARPFEHRRHEILVCSECHGTGEQHRTLLVRTPRDCASCHHDTRRGFECTTCHLRDSLPEQRDIAVTLALGVWHDSARTRVLPFGHTRHTRVACVECHQTPVTLQLNRSCNSCHARHDQPEATCQSCHAGELKPAHRAEAHFGCTGSGCHATSAALQPAQRNTCLACHTEQSTHEPGGNCASCHQIPSLPDTLRGAKS